MKNLSQFCLLPIFLFILFACFFNSCKKDDEVQEPSVDIQSPAENSNFIVGDSIHVIAQISSEEIITEIDVRLADEDEMTVQSVKCVYPNAHDYDLNLYYNIYGKNLQSGKYYLIIQVNYADTYVKKYRQVYIHELPLKFEGLLVLTASNVNTTSLYNLGTGLAPSLLHEFPSDHSFATVNCMGDRFFLSGKDIGMLFSYDLKNNAVAWEKENDDNPDFAFFQGMNLNDDLVFTSTSEGTIWGYSLNGDLDYIAYTSLPEYPAKIVAAKEFLLANVLKTSGTESFISQFVYPGGALIKKQQVGFKVVDFWLLDDYKVIIIGNDGNNTVLAYYDGEQQALTSILTIPGELAKNSCQVNNGGFLIVTNQKLRYWQFGASTTTVVMNTGNISSIRYESLDSRLYCSEGKLINVYSWPGLLLVNSVTMDKNIENILLRYNK